MLRTLTIRRGRDMGFILIHSAVGECFTGHLNVECPFSAAGAGAMRKPRTESGTSPVEGVARWRNIRLILASMN